MGRLKKIESPEKMWEYFLEYKKEIRENPILIVEQKKGNTVIPKGFEGELPEPVVYLPQRRPLTLEGFENWCEDNDVINDLGGYFANSNNSYSEYSTICLRIRRNIRQDQIEGGMAGIYNASITQRLNGLTEKTDNTTTIKLGKELEDDYE